MKPVSHYAIIPAAGRSLRMGARDKLLLPWSDATVMDHVLWVWTQSRTTSVIVVVRHNNSALREVCQRWPVDLVVPACDPTDMKESIRIGLQHAAIKYKPVPSDRWLMAPADLPTLSTGIINTLIDASGVTQSILVPRYGGRRGHPVSFPWSQMDQVMELEDDQGVDQLLDSGAVHWLDLPAHERPEDIDTPEDYEQRFRR